MANRFAVATGDYSSSAVWSTTDGGGSGAAAPTNVDAVFLTATSGNITVTISGAASAASLDCTGFTGTLALNATLTFGKAAGVNPTVTLNATMTLTSTLASTTSCMTLAATTLTATMTMNGATLPAALGGGQTATWNFTDTVRVTGQISADRGTWNFNAHTINCSSFSLGVNSALTRVIDLTNCTVNVSGTAGSTWQYTASESNITLTTTGSTINMTGNGTFFQTASGVSYNTVNFTGTGTITIQTGGATFANLSAANASILVFPISTTTTVTGTFTPPTTQIKSSAGGTTTTLSLTNNVTLTAFTVTDVIHSGAGTGTLLNPVSVTASSTGWVKQYTPATADSALASDAVTRNVHTAATAADSALASDAAVRASAATRTTAGDSALTTDHPTTGSLFLATAADSAAAADAATGRGTLHGRTADTALTADVAHPSGQPEHAADSALTTDFVYQNPVDQHPLAIDSGLVGHAMLGWWVLGGTDEGMPRLDVLVDPHSTTPVSTLSWNHTVTLSPNGLLLVQVGVANNVSQTVTGVTYGGIPLTRVVAEGTAPVRSDIWALPNPPAGTAAVVVTLSGTAPMSAASLSFFNVRQGTPVRSTITGNEWGAVITRVVQPTKQSDYIVDLLTIATTDILTPDGAQALLWEDQFETTNGPISVASSHEYSTSLAGSETIGWVSNAPTNWAYVAAALEPLLFQNVYAEDAANTTDVAHPSGQPAHSTDLALAADAAHASGLLIHCSDSAAAVDTIHASAPPAYARDVAITLDGPNRLTPAVTASDSSLLHDTVFRFVGKFPTAADTALTTDAVQRQVHDFRLPADTAYAWDYVSQLAPYSAYYNTSGVLGHAILGWWVLGNKDRPVKGYVLNDQALASDVAHAASGLRPRLTDFALAHDAAVRVAPNLRSAADHALAADQASPTRVQTGAAADSAVTADVVDRSIHLAGRTAHDFALATDAAHRQPDQPGHAYDAAYAVDAAVQFRMRTAHAADTSLTTDAAVGVYGLLAHDVALTTDSVVHTLHPRTVAFDFSFTHDTATASRLLPAVDTALTADAAVAARAIGGHAADSALAHDATTGVSHPGRATADTVLSIDSASKAQPRFVTDTALTADTAAAGRPSVRVTHDLAVTVDAAAWVRTQPRTTADAALAFDSALGGRLVSTHDVAVSFDGATIGFRLPRLTFDSAPAYDKATTYVRVEARLFTFGNLLRRWRFGRIVTKARIYRASDFAGRP